MAKVLGAMGYRIGRQPEAELLYHRFYFEGDFNPIISYCRKAEAFQDVPFSAPFTFSVLDRAFPDSKFILTIRESAEEWYASLTRFHAKLFGDAGALPTGAQLRAAQYCAPGFMANLMRLNGTSDEEPYEKNRLLMVYERHNAAVRAHFATRPTQLLEINVAHADALGRLEDFLGRASGLAEMPHENRAT
jgi:hypothetical protein